MTALRDDHRSGPPRTVADAVANVLADRADHVYGILGNGNAYVVSALTVRGLPFTAARHEAATVLMADAHHRSTGRIAAATTTYGAGYTNTYTALAEARLARVPLVLVVGDSPTTGMRPFDIDQTAASAALGVRTLTVTAENAAALARQAFDLALRTVQPVVLAIPTDVQDAPLVERGEGEVPPLPAKPDQPATPADVAQLAQLLRSAQRPLVLAGRGVVLSGTASEALRLGDELGALFMTTLTASNVVDSPWNLGISGGFSRRHRWEIARRADVVLVLGASLNAFQLRHGAMFQTDARIVRIDNEPIPHPASAPIARTVKADLQTLLPQLADAVAELPAEGPGWRAAVPEVDTPAFHAADAVEDPAEFGPDGRLNPRAVVAALDAILPTERSVVTDGGHFIGWGPMYLSVPDPQALVLVGTVFQSIGLGFGSAAGVSVARPDRTTVFVTGDGGGLMGLADLETFVRTTRHGVIVVLNDSAYGAELHQYAAQGLDPTAMLIPEVDFVALGRAFGADGVRARTLADLEVLRAWLASGEGGVFVLDVQVSQQVVAEFMAEAIKLAARSRAANDDVGTES